MAKGRETLSAVMVRQAPAGKYGDGGGLWLFKSGKDTGSWVLRVSVHGRLRYMGLGSIADQSLKEAREAADKWRKVARAGHDPIKERERERRERERNLHLLRDVAADAFEAQKASLKGDGKAGRWFSPLELHILPKLGKVPVADIDQISIRDALVSIWREKAATAEKAIQRLHIVMRHAAALGYDVDLQATMKAKALLGAQGREVEHIPSMPWHDVPAFYASLSDGTVTHLALRLLILTGVRSAPLRFLHVDHIAGDVWTIPSILMKSRKGKASDFDVPLSAEALAVIEQARRHARDGFLFPAVGSGGRRRKDGSAAQKKAAVISDATMAKLMADRKLDARPHGFRSSLRVFLAEHAMAPRDHAEMILQHVVGSEVERSYQRSALLDIRRGYMDRWARWVTTGKADANNVVEFRAGAVS